MHPQIPRRPSPTKGFTLPTISYTQPVLPLTEPSPSSSRTLRSSARRLSYGIKNRLGRCALPLSLGGIITIVLLFMTWSKGHGYPYPSAHRLKLYTREQIEQTVFDGVGSGRHALQTGKKPANDDELLAEDDVFEMVYKEPPPPTEAEKEAEEEFEAHRQDVIERNAIHSAKALLWFIAQGNSIPSSFEMPSKVQMAKMGGKGMEKLLESLDKKGKTGRGKGRKGKQVQAIDADVDLVFPEGWLQVADQELKLVVFSKSYCPYSKRAKSILSKYRINPSPYIVELDQRSDMAHVQNLLLQLTGRRTVPNIMLNFKSLGGADELTLLDAEGGLQKTFDDAGVGRPKRNAYIPRPNRPPAPPAPRDPVPARLPQQPQPVAGQPPARRPEARPAVVNGEENVAPNRRARQPQQPQQPENRAPVAPARIDIDEAIRRAHRVADAREGLGEYEGDFFDRARPVDSPSSDKRNRGPADNVAPGRDDRARQANIHRDRTRLDQDANAEPVARRPANFPVRGNAPVAAQGPEVDEDLALPAANRRVPPNGIVPARRPPNSHGRGVTKGEAEVEGLAIDTVGRPRMANADPRRRPVQPNDIRERLDIPGEKVPGGQEPVLGSHGDLLPPVDGRGRRPRPRPPQDLDRHIVQTEDADMAASPQALPKYGKVVHAPHPEDAIPPIGRARMGDSPQRADRLAAQNPLMVPEERTRLHDLTSGSENDSDQADTDRETTRDTLDDSDSEAEADGAFPRQIETYVDPELSAVLSPEDLDELDDRYDDRDDWEFSASPSSSDDLYEGNDNSFLKAPNPRQLEDDGIAALSAAAYNLRRRPNGKKLRDAMDVDEGSVIQVKESAVEVAATW